MKRRDISTDQIFAALRKRWPEVSGGWGGYFLINGVEIFAGTGTRREQLARLISEREKHDPPHEAGK